MKIEDLERSVSQDGHYLDLSYYRVLEKYISSVCCFLSKHPSITSLDISDNILKVKAAKALAANTTITALNIGNNFIGGEGVQALATNNKLLSLDVSLNHFNDEGAKALAGNNTITTLSLMQNNISNAGASALAENATITTLNVSHNIIADAGAKALANNTTITTLKIGNNKISLLGAKALVTNANLTALDISSNNLNKEDIKALINVLKNNTNLVEFLCGFEKKLNNETVEKILTRNKVLPWLHTIRYARLMAQAQQSLDCPFGTLPVEVLGMINNYLVGTNQYSFFIAQFDKRPTSKDLITAKHMALT